MTTGACEALSCNNHSVVSTSSASAMMSSSGQTNEEHLEQMTRELATRIARAGQECTAEVDSPSVLTALACCDEPLLLIPKAFGALGKWWDKVRRMGLRGALTQHVERAAECATHASEVIRRQWRTEDYVVGRIPPGAPHGQQAVHRNAAVGFASALATGAGAEVYVVQQSAVDQKNGLAGRTIQYWATDWKAQCRVDPVPPVPLFVMVDVDFHINMTEFLGGNFRSVLIYTFVPEAAGRAGQGYSFHFNEDQTLTYTNDARTFNHLLWDWTGDTVTVEWKGKFSLFRLDRRHLCQDRMLLLLTPIKRWEGIWAWLAQQLTPGWKLERFKPVRNGWTVIRSRTDDADTISVAQVSSPLAATLPVTSFEACRLESLRAEKQGHHLTKPQVLSHLQRGSDPLVLQGTATVLSLYLQQRGGRTAMQNPAGVAFAQPTRLAPQTRPALISYEPLDGYDGGSNAAMTAYMKPLIKLPCVPAQCLGNESRAARGRVTNLANLSRTCHPKLLQMMNFVLHKLIPSELALQGHPTELAEVLTRQSRPTQRQIIHASQFDGLRPDTTTRVFMKREAYTNLKDPRIISQITGSIKVAYSSFCYAFGDCVMHGLPFVACGMTPVEIARRVAEICSIIPGQTGVLEADVSRFDGHENYVMRKLFEGAMYRFFAPEHHADLDRLLRQQHTQRAVTRFGHKYDTGPARLSGSPETTIANTLENSFIVFCTIVRALGCSYEEGWTQLCATALVLGDDSIQGIGDTADWQEAAIWAGNKCGHVIEAKTHWPHGTTLPCFLSRMFSPRVFWGGQDSMSCLMRAVSKVHVCTTLGKPGLDGKLAKLVEKAFSGRCMDANTPILGSFYRRVFELAAIHNGRLLRSVEAVITKDPKSCSDVSWWTRQYGSNESTWWPNADVDGWMRAVCDEELADFDYGSFEAWLHGATRLEDLLDAPLFWSGEEEDVLLSEPSEPVVINDDEVLLPSQAQAHGSSTSSSDAQAVQEAEDMLVQIPETPIGQDQLVSDSSTSSVGSGPSRRGRRRRHRWKQTPGASTSADNK